MTQLREELALITAKTLEHYSERAADFWEGTREHDVKQNIQALLRHIRGGTPLRILDFGCGPGRDLAAFRSLGHEPIGLEGMAGDADSEDARAALPGLQHPLESHRVVLGHVRAHDRDHVGVREVLLEGRGAAATAAALPHGPPVRSSGPGSVCDSDLGFRGAVQR